MFKRALISLFIMALFCPAVGLSSVTDGLANATTNPFCVEGYNGDSPMQPATFENQEIDCSAVPGPVGAACGCSGNRLSHPDDSYCQKMIQMYGTQLKGYNK